jgi:hypothetical protein
MVDGSPCTNLKVTFGIGAAALNTPVIMTIKRLNPKRENIRFIIKLQK